ncbi:MAG: hypothetical protein LBS69_03710 [Prevotellaceae bacterium]|jgi:hypothetical protein|nr:hypothetical protein [Prevotellaceae bacterium]
MGLLDFGSITGLFDSLVKEKHINDMMSEYIKAIPLNDNEEKNVLIVSIEKDDKCYVSECGMKYNRTIESWQITKTKQSILFYKLLLKLIKNARGKN